MYGLFVSGYQFFYSEDFFDARLALVHFFPLFFCSPSPSNDLFLTPPLLPSPFPLLRFLLFLQWRFVVLYFSCGSSFFPPLGALLSVFFPFFPPFDVSLVFSITGFFVGVFEVLLILFHGAMLFSSVFLLCALLLFLIFPSPFFHCCGPLLCVAEIDVVLDVFSSCTLEVGRHIYFS